MFRDRRVRAARSVVKRELNARSANADEFMARDPRLIHEGEKKGKVRLFFAIFLMVLAVALLSGTVFKLGTLGYRYVSYKGAAVGMIEGYEEQEGKQYPIVSYQVSGKTYSYTGSSAKGQDGAEVSSVMIRYDEYAPEAAYILVDLYDAVVKWLVAFLIAAVLFVLGIALKPQAEETPV